MSDYEDSFASVSDGKSRDSPTAPKQPTAPTVNHTATPDDDPLSILDRLQSYKAGASSFPMSSIMLGRTEPTPLPVVPTVTPQTTRQPDSIIPQTTSSNNKQDSKPTSQAARDDDSSEENGDGEDYTSVDEGASQADLSVHTEHYSEAGDHSVYSTDRKHSELDVRHSTGTTIHHNTHKHPPAVPTHSTRHRQQHNHRHHQQHSDSHGRSRTRSKESMESRQHSHHSTTRSKQSQHSQAYNDVVLQGHVHNGASGGLLLTPKVTPPTVSVESLAIRQALGVHAATQSVIQQYPATTSLQLQFNPTNHPITRSHADRDSDSGSDSESERESSSSSSSVSTRHRKLKREPINEDQILELLLRLAVLDASKRQSSNNSPEIPAVEPVNTHPQPTAPLPVMNTQTQQQQQLASLQSSLQSSQRPTATPITSEPQLRLQYPSHPTAELSPSDDAKLRCEHPSWQLQFQQQYSSGVTALLNSLKPQQHPSSDHAVSEAISAAFTEVLCDAAVIRLVQQSVISKLIGSSVDGGDAVVSDRPVPRHVLPSQHSARSSNTVDSHDRDEVVFVPAVIRNSTSSQQHPNRYNNNSHVVTSNQPSSRRLYGVRDVRSSLSKRSRSLSHSATSTSVTTTRHQPSRVVVPVYDTRIPRPATANMTPRRYGKQVTAATARAHAELLQSNQLSFPYRR